MRCAAGSCRKEASEGYRRCDSCRAAVLRWQEANPDRVRATGQRAYLRAKYDLTVEDYDEMLMAQEGKCAICRLHESAHSFASGKLKRLSVDHDHASGKVRGLLCDRCNRAIGLLADSTDNLRAAIAYLDAA